MSARPAFDVLVTGAEEHQGVAIIRALGREGHRVFAAGRGENSVGFKSRYAKGRLSYTSPYESKERAAEQIRDVVKANGIPFVIPVTESSVIALDEYRDMFNGITTLALPSRESLQVALDKRRTDVVTKRLGIPMPRGIDPASIDEALAFSDEVGFPLVMKPSGQRIYGAATGGFSFKAIYVHDRTVLLDYLTKFEKGGAFPLLQQYCPGVKVAHQTLSTRGKLAYIYQYKGAREFPLTGGISSLYESQRVDPRLRDWTERLLGDIGWDGVAMPEYKFDERTGSAVLLELNGRFAAPVAGAIDAGMNFPHSLLTYMKTGTPAPMPADYPIGKRMRYLRGDLEGLWMLASGDTDGALWSLPSVAAAARNVLAAASPSVKSEMLAMDDPLPGIVDTARVVGDFAGRVGSFVLNRIRSWF